MTEEKESVFMDFEPNDYIIRLSPFLDQSGNWTGELMVGTVTTGENDLSDDDHYSLMQLTQLVCASVPVLEENEIVRKILSEIVDTNNKQDTEVEVTLTKIEEVEDNVIKVRF